MSAVRDGQHLSNNCVTAVIFIYRLRADHAVNSFTTVDMILVKMSGKLNTLRAFLKRRPVYTVVLYSMWWGGVHLDSINVTYCLQSQPFSLIVFA